MPTVTMRVKRISPNNVRDPHTGQIIPADRFIDVVYHRETAAAINAGELVRESVESDATPPPPPPAVKESDAGSSKKK